MSNFQDAMMPLSWDNVRRNSLANIASRRSSLLSVSLFDFFPPARTEAEQEMTCDPFAPLSINEGISLAAKSPQFSRKTRGSDVFLNDRSESSVPSVSGSSYSSSSHATLRVGLSLDGSARNLDFASHTSPRAQEYTSHDSYHSPVHAAVAPMVKSAFPSTVTAAAVAASAPKPPFADDAPEDDEDNQQQRFKPFHEEKWSVRYKELLEFHKEFNHSAVPHTYPKNPQLARWVKRQRRQYKLRRDGRPSTMTLDRLELLNSVGFVWDSHDVNWREKLEALSAFRKSQGHCNVPSNYQDKKLATWVKCQRRQYKLYWDGKPSAMSPERILELEKIGFEWEIRAASRTAPQPAQAMSSAGEDYNLLY